MNRYDRLDRHNRPKAGRRASPRPEPLESRRLLATFLVTTTADFATESFPGTLRQAILNANNNPGPDRIEFAIPQDDNGYVPATADSPAFWSIQPLSALPEIARGPRTPGVPNPVTIDATTQPGYNGRPVVEINGINAGVGVDGLRISAGDSAVYGLAINQFQLQIVEGARVGGSGIHLIGNGGNIIQGNYLGPDVSAARRVGNGRAGLFIDNSPGNLVGGTTPGAGNLLSSNRTDGLFIQGSLASGNVVQGNVIGTNFDFNPQADLANLIDGVEIDGAPGNLIGGTVPGAGNVIARNNGNGVSLRRAGASGNAVQGNLIGTDGLGGLLLGNLLDGVFISGASNNVIGGTVPEARNTIGRNRIGVDIQPLTGDPGGPVDATGNAVLGNFIGIGVGPLGNSIRLDNLTDGVNVGGSRNVIGQFGAGNVISRNGANGVQIVGRDLGGAQPFGFNNTLQGNRIGTDLSGSVAFPNAQNGVVIDSAAGIALSLNQISGNGTAGIVILGAAATGNVVSGNRVGTDASGASALGNGTDGLALIGAASGNLIGGAAVGGGNLFSGNGVSGLRFAQGASNNAVQGNVVGLDASGQGALGNGVYGILIGDGASANLIGSPASGFGNVISSNRVGVQLTGLTTTGNAVQGNVIGVLDAESQQTGVLVENAPGNVVGGTDAGAGNSILRNSGTGVQISGAGSTGDALQGNRVIGNGGNGVLLLNASGNLVGGSQAGAGNQISGNGGAGVAIQGAGAAGNILQGNFIGTTADASAVIGNISYGILIQDAPRTLIGGSTTGGDGNILGGNRTGVEVEGGSAVGTVIQGNFVGTNRNGADLGNLNDGIALVDVVAALVGGSFAAARNVVSGNTLDGVHVVRGSSSVILGNYVGTAPSGTSALPNGSVGIHLEGASATRVGGPGGDDGNLASGNGVTGVRVDGAGAVAPQILGNRIGTDDFGGSAIPNAIGVLLDDVSSVLVQGNQISGNSNFGVQIVGSSAANQLVENFIGLARNGARPLPNAIGVLVDGAPANLIGPGNVISGNDSVGVEIFGIGATGNVVFGNIIGADANGTGAVEFPGGEGNQARLQDIGVLMNDAPGNVVGGASADLRNVISSNLVGIEVAGVNSGAPANSDRTANAILGNLIGTDATGARPLGNIVGVYVNGVPGVRIGGTGAGEGNVISANTSIGVSLFGIQTNAVAIEGNLIGTSSDGQSTFLRGNRQFVQPVGIFLENTSSNRIGGGSAGSRNVLSGNDVAGVYIFGRRNVSRGNLVQNNLIGLGANGRQRIGNRSYGVLLFNSASNTVVRGGRNRNRFGPNGIANFREFTGPVPRGPSAATIAQIRGVTRGLGTA